jgi:short-subunit dehydrogenase
MDLTKYGPWAVIVGGSEGVGAEFARQLASDGFKLVLVARKPEPLEALAAELRDGGAEVRAVSADLSKPDVLSRVRAATDDVEVGLLVFNAGANNTRGYFVELPEEVTHSVIAVNVLAQSNFARHYGKLMCDRRRGGIILTGSLGGYMGSASLAAYCGAKAFSRVFTEALWMECADFGVDVLHLNIGYTATPAMARLGMDTASPRLRPRSPGRGWTTSPTARSGSSARPATSSGRGRPRRWTTGPRRCGPAPSARAKTPARRSSRSATGSRSTDAQPGAPWSSRKARSAYPGPIRAGGAEVFTVTPAAVRDQARMGPGSPRSGRDDRDQAPAPTSACS